MKQVSHDWGGSIFPVALILKSKLVQRVSLN